jgi:hypothetical protein
VRAPQRPHPRLIRQPHRCTSTAGRQLQPRALLDRRPLRAAAAAAQLRERWLREAPRDAGEPPEPPWAEAAADDGDGLVRELVVAQRQRRISGRRVVVVCCHMNFSPKPVRKGVPGLVPSLALEA